MSKSVLCIIIYLQAKGDKHLISHWYIKWTKDDDNKEQQEDIIFSWCTIKFSELTSKEKYGDK